MPYARRNQSGEIVALFQAPMSEGENLERVAPSDPAVLQFLLKNEPSGQELIQFLSSTDTGMVRVLEDVVELLIDKNVILFTELPVPAQQKLLTRRRARETLQSDHSIIVSEKDIL
jgi:hypothetical protein